MLLLNGSREAIKGQNVAPAFSQHSTPALSVNIPTCAVSQHPSFAVSQHSTLAPSVNIPTCAVSQHPSFAVSQHSTLAPSANIPHVRCQSTSRVRFQSTSFVRCQSTFHTCAFSQHPSFASVTKIFLLSIFLFSARGGVNQRPGI